MNNLSQQPECFTGISKSRTGVRIITASCWASFLTQSNMRNQLDSVTFETTRQRRQKVRQGGLRLQENVRQPGQRVDTGGCRKLKYNATHRLRKEPIPDRHPPLLGGFHIGIQCARIGVVVSRPGRFKLRAGFTKDRNDDVIGKLRAAGQAQKVPSVERSMSWRARASPQVTWDGAPALLSHASTEAGVEFI